MALTVLQRLDALIAAADELNAKLILPLITHWDDMGGMSAYVKWLGDGADVRSSIARRVILTRRNSITGRLSSEEPAILAWELTNEAQCQTRGGRELLLHWTEEMAWFVKQGIAIICWR